MIVPETMLLCGHVIDMLHTLKPQSVHCCVTSPPYWRKRDYGTANISWPAGEYCPMPGLPKVPIDEWKGSLGMEPTPHMFTFHIVLIFRALWRVLRDDGTLWLNFGDTYATNRNDHVKGGFGDNSITEHSTIAVRGKVCPEGYKIKDLIGIPWMVAFALMGDGWYLRNDLIWNKPNPKPESVKDRCTVAHEYFFLLTKEKKYYFNQEAIKVPCTKEGIARMKKKNIDGATGQTPDTMNQERPNDPDRVVPTVRNRRTVWRIAVKGYKGAHFAVFPPELVLSPILAGTSDRGCCPICGAGWVQTKTGWKPGCVCMPKDEQAAPPVVIDIFNGAGTVGVVSKQLGRSYIGIDLSTEYIEMPHDRIKTNEPLLFGAGAEVIPQVYEKQLDFLETK